MRVTLGKYFFTSSRMFCKVDSHDVEDGFLPGRPLAADSGALLDGGGEVAAIDEEWQVLNEHHEHATHLCGDSSTVNMHITQGQGGTGGGLRLYFVNF